MELFLSLLFWIFGFQVPGPHQSPRHLQMNPASQGSYISQPAVSPQPVIELDVNSRRLFRNGQSYTIVIFEDTHFRPVKN